MNLIKGLVGAIAIGAIVLSAKSARADNDVYGGSSGLASATTPPSGDYLALTYSGGTQFAPLGVYSFSSGTSEIIEITHGDSGWFTSSTEEGPGGDSYVTGNVSGSHLRSFLSFNTSGLPVGVVAASLVLNTYTVVTPGTDTVDFLGGVNNFDGNGPADSTIDANHFLATEENSSSNSSTIATIYSALGTGPLYGSFGYINANTGTQVSVPLTSNFLSDINSSLASANSLFTVGLDDVASIPEPGSFALLAIATPIALRRRRRTS
jgi:hypothetical protein